MKRLLVIATGLLVAACSSLPAWVPGSGWTTLIDGEKGLENFTREGDANWRAEGGAIVADKGKGGHLVTKNSYKDFQIRAEFWADHNTNSGIFMRIQDPQEDRRRQFVRGEHLRPARPARSTAPAASSTSPRCRCRRLQGRRQVEHVRDHRQGLAGRRRVQRRRRPSTSQNSKFAQGPFSLQFGNHGKAPGGAIRWRKVQVRESKKSLSGVHRALRGRLRREARGARGVARHAVPRGAARRPRLADARAAGAGALRDPPRHHRGHAARLRPLPVLAQPRRAGAWGGALGIAYFAGKRRARAAAILFAVVLSHWLLDFATHRPDMPLTIGGEERFGLGLWHSRIATLAVEGLLFGACVWLYARTTRALDRTGRWSFVAFVAFPHRGLRGQCLRPAAAERGGGGVERAGDLATGGLGYWIDRHRAASRN